MSVFSQKTKQIQILKYEEAHQYFLFTTSLFSNDTLSASLQIECIELQSDIQVLFIIYESICQENVCSTIQMRNMDAGTHNQIAYGRRYRRVAPPSGSILPYEIKEINHVNFGMH